MGPFTLSLILQYLILVLNTGEMGDINLRINKYLWYRIQMLDKMVILAKVALHKLCMVSEIMFVTQAPRTE